MSFEEIIDVFAEEAPAATLFCGLAKRVSSPARLDELFRDHKQRQVEGPLLFSNLIHLLTPVVTSKSRTVSASHRTQETKIGVSRQAVYDKLQGVECSVSEALVRIPAVELADILRMSGVGHEDIVPGQQGCLYIADRNFCDGPTLSDFHAAEAYFIVRQHRRSPRWRLAEGSRRKRIGQDARGGVVYEQAAEAFVDGVWTPVRRITVELTSKTRDGDEQLHLFSNLPASVLAVSIADGYRGRWKIETCLAHLAQMLNAEIKTLAYPKAALLCFALALACYNVVVTLSQLISHHAPKNGAGPKKKSNSDAKKKPDARPQKKLNDLGPLSPYYISLEIVDTWRGLEIATKAFDGWTILAEQPLKAFCDWCRSIAKRANAAKYRKTTRGPKKKPPRRKQLKKSTHMSTQALINHRKPHQVLA